MNNIFNRILLATALLLGFKAQAIETKVYASGTDNFNDMAFSGSAQTQQGTFTIKMIASCFNAKQKPVFNPISGVGAIAFQIGIAGLDFSVAFPAWITRPAETFGAADSAIIDLTSTTIYSTATIGSAFATRNLVLIRASAEPSITAIDALGNYVSGDRVDQITYLRFKYDQTQTPCPPPPAAPTPNCTQPAGAFYKEKNRDSRQQAALQASRFFSRPLAMLMSQFANAGMVPFYGLPQDNSYNQPDFSAPGWGLPAGYDMRYSAQDGAIGAMTRINYASDMKQLEIQAIFPSYDTHCRSYF